MVSITLDDPDLWDDLELNRIWDATFAEYKKYHSLVTSREEAEKLIREFESEEMTATEFIKQLQGSGTPDLKVSKDDFLNKVTDHVHVNLLNTENSGSAIEYDSSPSRLLDPKQKMAPQSPDGELAEISKKSLPTAAVTLKPAIDQAHIEPATYENYIQSTPWLQHQTNQHKSPSEEASSVFNNFTSFSPAPDSLSGVPIPPIPNLPIGENSNESFKNILMAWFYAGYHAGRYLEDQRQKHSSK